MSSPTPFLTDRFDAARLLACSLQQRRKSTDVPYTSHLLAVTSLVLEMSGTEDEAIGALLHDVVEDGGPEELVDIQAHVGTDVARIVSANSDTDVKPKPTWRAGKQEYIAAIDRGDRSLGARPVARPLATGSTTLGRSTSTTESTAQALWDRFKAGEGESVRWH